jgi:hypothetical protein
MTEFGERTVAPFEVSGGQIIEHQATLGEMAFGQGLLDARLLREQPVHRLVKLDFIGGVQVEDLTETVVKGIAVKATSLDSIRRPVSSSSPVCKARRSPMNKTAANTLSPAPADSCSPGLSRSSLFPSNIDDAAAILTYMSPTSSSAEQIADAIAILQDALRKEAFDKKAVHADVVKASNILLSILGLPSVAPDVGAGAV